VLKKLGINNLSVFINGLYVRDLRKFEKKAGC
jgi:hypothetical protein